MVKLLRMGQKNTSTLKMINRMIKCLKGLKKQEPDNDEGFQLRTDFALASSR